MRSLAFACAGLLSLQATLPLHAQPEPARSPAFVPSWHWSQLLVRRMASTALDSMTSAPRFAPLTWEDVHSTLERTAAAADARGQVALASYVRAELARLRAEESTRPWLDHGSLVLGWSAARGEARAGDGYFREEDWTGADVLASASAPAIQLDAGGALGAFAWTLTAGHALGDPFLHEATLTARVRTLQFWAGRRPLRFAMGRSGGLTVGPGELSSLPLLNRVDASIDGFGFFFHEPFHVPLLRPLIGRLEGFVGQLGAHGRFPEPYFAGARLIGHPFTRRITLGAYRAVAFGGEGNPATARDLIEAMVGVHAKQGLFANHVLALTVALQPPLGDLPLHLYGEWGFDDGSGAISDVPGLVLGAEVGALPGAPHVGIGVEAVHFSPDCCGNPIWYRNIFSRAGWADGNRFLAHPLGGEGNQLSVYADVSAAGMLANARLFARERGEDNLLSPGREGRSAGVSARAEGRDRIPLLLDGTAEWGSGWSTFTLFAGARLRF